MPYPILCEITLPSGNTYQIQDAGAREMIAELLNFHDYLGVTTSAIVEDSTINPVMISGQEVTAVQGDVVTRDSDHVEFVFSSVGTWQPFGSLTGLGALAYKNSASGAFTPTGTVSQPTFSGSCTPEGSVGNVALGTKTVKELKTTGTLPSCTMPTYAVSNGRLTITDGSFNAGALPTGEDVTVGDGTVTTQPTFTGSTTSVAGTVSQPTFTGTEGTVTVS